MLSVKGIYENKQLHLLEPVPHKKRIKVIVTFLEDFSESEENENEVNVHAFDDLVGVIDVREDGSEAHDKYITSHAAITANIKGAAPTRHPFHPYIP